jgi:hypothetical protein
VGRLDVWATHALCRAGWRSTLTGNSPEDLKFSPLLADPFAAGPLGARAQEGAVIERATQFVRMCACLGAAWLLGCAAGAWELALTEDTPAAYHHYLREHPKSKHRVEAQERLEYHGILRGPTLSGFERFSADHPGSPLIEKLRPVVEEQAFAAARAVGTPEAYRDFMARFPGGSFSERASGNAAYAAARGFDGDLEHLERFAAHHPQSDFASEARRSAESVALREGSRFDDVELLVDVSSRNPQRERLKEILTQHAAKAYRNAGIRLTAAESGESPAARLTIRHSEELESSSVSEGRMTRPSVFARAEVVLELMPGGAVIWQREFSLRVPAQDSILNTSVLLASKTAELFWSEFFVPVATWNSRVSTRQPIELPKKAVAVDSARNRVVVLFEDGGFQLLDLADPLAPVLLAEYTHAEKFENYEGVRIRGDEVILYGQDGLQTIRLTAEGIESVASSGRGDVGSIVGVEPVGDDLLVAGSHGLLRVPGDGTSPQRIMRRVVRGLAAVGDTLVFTDGDTIYMSTLELLKERRVLAQLRTGREFAPGRVRALGDKVVVIGQRGVLLFDLSDPQRPRQLARLKYDLTGRVEDVSLVGGRIALLGSRGLQLLDQHAQRVVESIDVKPGLRVVRMDRHLVVAGGQELQVVDATPFLVWDSNTGSATATPASPQ